MATKDWKLDLWDSGLSNQQRDAYAAIVDLFTSYGLGSLAPTIFSYIKGGHSADTISILVQETPEYKQRFVANEARRQKGLPVLSPAEYLSVEKSYRQIMSASGVPVGFYDSPADYRALIEADISPQEVQDRVKAATELVHNAPAEARAAFSQWYSTGDMIAYALDPKKAASAVQRVYAAATAGGYAKQQGLTIGQGTAEDIARLGLQNQAVSEGFANIAGELPNAQKLAQISGDTLTTEDLISETFQNDAGVAQKRQKLASAERGRFTGASAVGTGSIGKASRGSGY